MVETTVGLELARITIISSEYKQLYNKHVKPKHPVINYYFKFSGIRKEDLQKDGVITLEQMQKDLKSLFDKDTILVGHSLENDLNVMKIIHRKVIDTSLLYATRTGKKLGLKLLSSNHLKYKIQNGSHDSFEDTKATLALMKYKIDIVDKLGLNLDQGDDKLFKKLVELKNTLILDETRHLRSCLNYGTMYVECKDTNQDEIFNKLVKNADKKDGPKADMIFSRLRIEATEDQEEAYKKLNEHLKDLFKVMREDTLFILATIKKKNRLEEQETETETNETDRLYNSFFIFVK